MRRLSLRTVVCQHWSSAGSAVEGSPLDARLRGHDNGRGDENNCGDDNGDRLGVDEDMGRRGG